MDTRFIHGLQTLLVTLVLGLTGVGHAADEPSYTPQAQPVAPNVYAIVGPLGQRSPANAGLNANFGFVVTPEGVVLIDSGASAHGAAMLAKAVRAVTQQPIQWVLNTGSQDHRWLGDNYFARRQQGCRTGVLGPQMRASP